MRSSTLSLLLAGFASVSLLSSGVAQGGKPFFVQDLNKVPRTKAKGSTPQFWAEFAGKVFFSALSRREGREVFITKGTSATTKLLKDVQGGRASSNPTYLGHTKKFLFFLADDGIHGREIWVTDGTTLGTHLLVDSIPGTNLNGPLGLGTQGSLLYFQVPGTGKNIELWRTDGTGKGTRRLLAYQPSATEGFAGFSKTGQSSKGVLFFVRTNLPPKLFKTDGTALGTTLVTQLPGTSWPKVGIEVGSDGKRIYFPGFDSVHGLEVWSSDGTAQGTKLLKDLMPGKSWGRPNSFGLWNGRISFLSMDGKGIGYGFYGSDGTPAGTKLLSPAKIRVEKMDRAGPTAVLYAGGNPGTILPWLLTPGKAPVQTKLPVKVLLSYPPAFASPAGILIQTLELKGNRTWTVNRNTGQASLLASWGPALFQIGNWGLATKTKTYLVGGSNQIHLTEPYITDGTAKGTKLLKELYSSKGTNSFEPFAAFPLGTKTRFFGQGLGNPLGLWSWNGLPSKVKKLQSFSQVFVYPQRDYVRALPERAFAFTGFPGGVQLLSLNAGTPFGTPLLKGGRNFGQVVPPLEAIMGDKLFFQFSTTNGLGNELYVSDGTAKGTKLLKDIASGTNSSNISHFATLGNRVFFSATQKGTGEEPWVSDGSAAGTQLLVDIVKGPSSSVAQSFVRWDGRAWFLAKTGLALGLFPHYTDSKGKGFQGAVFSPLLPNGFNQGSGTQMVATKAGLFAWDGKGIASIYVVQKSGVYYKIQHLPLQPNGLFALSVLPFGDKALVLGSHHSSPRLASLWLSDGTIKGSMRLATFWRDKSALLPLFRLGSRRALFRAQGQLWVSDGTKAGTHALLPNPPYDNPRPLTLAGGLFHFAAFDDAHGREPWAWFPGAHGVARGQGCGGKVLQTPELEVEDPVLGQSFAARGEAAPTNAAGLLLLGTPGSASQRLPSGAQLPCRIFLDLAQFWIPLPPFRTSPKGTWTQSFKAPNSLSLTGITVMLQALYPRGRSLFEVSNGYEVTFGK